jgi:hypothetical protein
MIVEVHPIGLDSLVNVAYIPQEHIEFIDQRKRSCFLQFRHRHVTLEINLDECKAVVKLLKEGER